MPSKWRTSARSIINGVIDEHPELRTPDGLKELFKLISRAYPWGERKYHPYKCWGAEVSIARRTLEREVGVASPNPLLVKCDACGARAFLPCHGIGSVADDRMVAEDAELEGRLEDAKRIRATAFHEARLIAVGLRPSEDTLPLFARAR